MKKYILGTGISLCLLMSSCLNDSFLEVYPKGQQTEATVFTTYVRGEKRNVSICGRPEND